jgi:hypothetical protein
MIMKIFKKFKDFLTEASGNTYDYGCAMLYFDFPKMSEIHDQIDPSDIYEEDEDKTYGLEDEPHCTLLYGLHKEVKSPKIQKILGEFIFGPCEIHNASLFENDKYDVLKFDVKNEELHKCNSALCKLPFTSDYPDYHPHMTIAYLKPGSGKKYVEKLKDVSYTLDPSHGVFSHPDGTKDRLTINKFKK